MNYTLKKSAQALLLPFLGIMLLLPSAHTQEVLASQGGFIATGNSYYSFTVGESLISTLSNAVVVVTQGFQQPGKLTVGVKTPFTPFQIQAFPNPTADAVVLTYQGPIGLFSLFETSGRLVSSIVPNPTVEQIEISFADLPAGMYLLRAVSETGKNAGFIRIVKQ